MTRTELMIYAQQTYDKAILNHKFIRYERLNACQAHYVDTGISVILKSYDTVVAIYNRIIGTLYVFDRYSATTAQHINKFARLFNWDRITYLYKRSDGILEISTSRHICGKAFKPSKDEWENLYKFDFSMEITSRWD